MKKILSLLFAFIISSSVLAQKTMTFQAEIANRNSDVIYIKDKKDLIIKEIKINSKGFFKSTFSINEGLYIMFDGVEITNLFLKNGYNLKLTMDAQHFDESIKYSGKGEKENNYLAQMNLPQIYNDLDYPTSSDPDVYNKQFDKIKDYKINQLVNLKLDPFFVKLEKKTIEDENSSMKFFYNQSIEIKKLNNTVAPPFDYVNADGTKTKLEDFKGKYVYIDVWATWCGPCRGELPSLMIVEEKYKEKNIAFVSISVDENKDFEKWKNFVSEKQLGGTQLIADNSFKSDFMKAFTINAIPRFILIDPTGKIVNADADSPSDPDLQKTLDELLK